MNACPCVFFQRAIVLLLFLAASAHCLLQWDTYAMQHGVADSAALGVRLILASGSSRIHVDALVHTALQTTILVPRYGCVIADSPGGGGLLRETFGGCIGSQQGDGLADAELDRICDHARRHSLRRRVINFSDGSFVSGLQVNSNDAGVFLVLQGLGSLGVASSDATALRGSAKTRYAIKSFLLAETISRTGNMRQMLLSHGITPHGVRALIGVAPRAAAALFFSLSPDAVMNHQAPSSGVHSIIVLRAPKGNDARRPNQGSSIVSRRILFCRPFLAIHQPPLYTMVIASVALTRPIAFSTGRIGGAVVDVSCPYIVLPESIYRVVAAELCRLLLQEQSSDVAVERCVSSHRWISTGDRQEKRAAELPPLFLHLVPHVDASSMDGADAFVPWHVPLSRLIVVDAFGNGKHLLRSTAEYFHLASQPRLALMSVIGSPAVADTDVALNPRPDAGHPPVGIVVTTYSSQGMLSALGEWSGKNVAVSSWMAVGMGLGLATLILWKCRRRVQLRGRAVRLA